MSCSSSLKSTGATWLLGVAAWLAASWASSSVAQTPEARERDPLATLAVAHRQALQIERERELLERYCAAPAELRARAEDLLRAGRDPRSPRLNPLPLATIAAARRALEDGEPSSELEPWFDLVDSLDLRVVPGLFCARREGRGEALTVTLVSLWDSRVAGGSGGHERGALEPGALEPEGGVEASLIWISPDGEELRARREPVSAAALDAGFEMYIRPPASGAGLWSLCLELRTSLGLVRSAPVPVECVEDLAGLRARLASAPGVDHPAAGRELARRIEDACQHGLRRASGLSIETWSERLSSGAAGPTPRPFDAGDLRTAGASLWELAPRAEPSKRMFLLLVAQEEHPTDVLTGPVGRAWSRVYASEAVRVLAARLPLPGAEGLDLRELARHLKGVEGVEHLVVVARGDFGRALPRELMSEPCADIDALVLSETPAVRAPLPEELQVPTLQLEFSAQSASELGSFVASSAGHTRWRSTRPAVIGVATAPELMAAWAAQL
jgi:hypothetical protein